MGYLSSGSSKMLRFLSGASFTRASKIHRFAPTMFFVSVCLSSTMWLRSVSTSMLHGSIIHRSTALHFLFSSTGTLFGHQISKCPLVYGTLQWVIVMVNILHSLSFSTSCAYFIITVFSCY